MKTIIITGASSGIGKAIVELLEKEDYKLILVARSEDKLKELAEGKENVFVYACDLMDVKNAEDVSKKIVEDFPEVDVLINNAGIGFPSKLDELSVKDYEKMMDTNVKGLIFFTKNILKQMKVNDKTIWEKVPIVNNSFLKKVNLGKIPIMLHSKLCCLDKMLPETLR